VGSPDLLADALADALALIAPTLAERKQSWQQEELCAVHTTLQ
jgi:hypothetical protein